MIIYYSVLQCYEKHVTCTYACNVYRYHINLLIKTNVRARVGVRVNLLLILTCILICNAYRYSHTNTKKLVKTNADAPFVNRRVVVSVNCFL
jgi:hypothetical protein